MQCYFKWQSTPKQIQNLLQVLLALLKNRYVHVCPFSSHIFALNTCTFAVRKCEFWKPILNCSWSPVCLSVCLMWSYTFQCAISCDNAVTAKNQSELF